MFAFVGATHFTDQKNVHLYSYYQDLFLRYYLRSTAYISLKFRIYWNESPKYFI